MMMMKDVEAAAGTTSTSTGTIPMKETEEDVSVIMTADDSSTGGTADEEAMTVPKRNNKGGLVGFIGVVAILLIMGIVTGVIVSVRKQEDATTMMERTNVLGEEANTPWSQGKPGCHKNRTSSTSTSTSTASRAEDENQDPVTFAASAADLEPAKVQELPTELPFADLAPMRGFSANLLQGYSSLEQLQDDITLAAKHVINQVIFQNVARQQYYAQSAWTGDATTKEEQFVRPSDVAQEVGVGATTAQASTTKKTGKTTTQLSKTNNQEEDADQADLVKNDEQFVYAALGDYLVVWDLHTGEQVTHVQMPSLVEEPTAEEAAEAAEGFAANKEWSTPAYINGLILTPDHVVAVVDAYTLPGKSSELEILSHYQGTQIRIYSKPTTLSPNMTLLATQTLSGSYHDGLWLEDAQTLHIVTSGDIDSYLYLVEPLSYHHFTTSDNNSFMTPKAYVQAATELATSTLLPKFVTALTEALLVNGQLPTMLQLNAWTATQDETTTGTPAMTAAELLQHLSRGEDRLYDTTSNVPLRSFLQVVSLHIDDLPSPNAVTVVVPESLPVSVSLLLPPTVPCHLYATRHDLVVIFTHYRSDDTDDDNDNTKNETNSGTQQDLFVIHLKVDTASEREITATLEGRAQAHFHALAMTAGDLNSPYSIDIQGDDLRLATTVQMYNVVDRVQRLCGSVLVAADDTCYTENAWDHCLDLVLVGCTQLDVTGCPYRYTCAHELEQEETREQESSTQNFVLVYDISEPGQMMVERGRVRLGKPHEVITAVRFGETFSYATTYDRRDPFYVLNLVPGQPPAIVGELKLDGFSSYLHPLDDTNNQLLVGIGQNVTSGVLEHQKTGLMITVFNVSNASNPIVIASLMVENDASLDSVSDAEWDAKAVQYANGKLILPVTMYHNGVWVEGAEDDDFLPETEPNIDDLVGEEAEVSRAGAENPAPAATGKNFEGFFVFNVGPSGIREAFRVTHASSAPGCHYCNGALTNSRSILLDNGSLITMYEDAIQSTNMTTGETLWTHLVELDGVPKDCCW